MAIPKHLAKIREDVNTWNRWRAQHPDLHGPDLRAADLGGANLSGANLHGADLREADISRADLRESVLRHADLRGANVAGTNLSGADLSSANLCGASLRGANLREANLHDADLRAADLRSGAALSGAELRAADMHEVRVGWTVFGNVDLSTVKGLEFVRHYGPSTIGIDTLYRSRGNVPEAFLHGAGVPEQFITYARSLVTNSIEFYSCFISYSNHDQEFAERLRADLRAKNLRIWFAPEDLKIGDRFQERIEESIRLFDKVMIVLSEPSVASRWVEREINAAREREDRENRTVLFPIRIDDAVMEAAQPWAADIRRTRYIGDFRRWKDHDSYQKAFERLLRDLRAS